MSSQTAGIGSTFNQWPNQAAQGPSMDTTNDSNEDGVSVRPMRRKFNPIEVLGSW